jgi:hypothetical protein
MKRPPLRQKGPLRRQIYLLTRWQERDDQAGRVLVQPINEINQLDPANVRTVNKKPCADYYGIADFWAKLLGLLPLARHGHFSVVGATFEIRTIANNPGSRWWEEIDGYGKVVLSASGL